MTTVTTPIAAADAIQRMPVECWLADGDHPQGFPNYPLWVDDNGAAQRTIDTATRCMWDGAFGWQTVRLLELIGADASKIPADASALTRAALLELYPDALTPPAATLPGGAP